MINKETIDELKKTHAEIFAAKMAVLKDEQVVASVILQQIEHDKQHPPEAIAIAGVQRAAEVLNTHASRALLAKSEFEKVVERVRAEFPGLDLTGIEIVFVPGADEASTQMIKELQEQLRLQGLKCVDIDSALCLQQDANRALQQRADAWAQQITDLQTELRAAKAIEEEMPRAFTEAESVHLANLKAAQELLKNVGACGNIKEVRELLKPAEPQQATTTTQAES